MAGRPWLLLCAGVLQRANGLHFGFRQLEALQYLTSFAHGPPFIAPVPG